MKNNLTGTTFKGPYNTEYIVLAGYENDSIVFAEKDNIDAPLWFACDVKIKSKRLYSSYKVSYTVSKHEFFNEIDSTDPVNSLKKKYYKIPHEFLELVIMIFEKERR